MIFSLPWRFQLAMKIPDDNNLHRHNIEPAESVTQLRWVIAIKSKNHATVLNCKLPEMRNQRWRLWCETSPSYWRNVQSATTADQQLTDAWKQKSYKSMTVEKDVEGMITWNRRWQIGNPYHIAAKTVAITCVRWKILAAVLFLLENSKFKICRDRYIHDWGDRCSWNIRHLDLEIYELALELDLKYTTFHDWFDLCSWNIRHLDLEIYGSSIRLEIYDISHDTLILKYTTWLFN